MSFISFKRKLTTIVYLEFYLFYITAEYLNSHRVEYKFYLVHYLIIQ
jgi:hypothetical protein